MPRGFLHVGDVDPKIILFAELKSKLNDRIAKGNVLNDRYAVIGDRAGVDARGRERWQIRVWWKPFVTFIWYGGVLIAMGGILSIAGRVQVDLKRRNAKKIAGQRRADLDALDEDKLPEPAE